MMLTEQTQILDSALPLSAFKQHLRLGSGFADDGAQDELLLSIMRAAIAAIEAWTGKVLLERDYLLELQSWRDPVVQALPVAPVSAIGAVTLVDRLGLEDVLDGGQTRLIKDTHRPSLQALSGALPCPDPSGSIWIEFTGGFGASWTDVPSDLSQAVMVLGAHYYEFRHDQENGKAAIPHMVNSLIERWRTVRLLGGRS